MILKRLFNPGWRRDRKAAGAAADGDRVAAQATGSPDPAARRQACKQARDPALLLQVSRDDADAGVRELAAARLRRLMEGGEPDGPELPRRLALLGQAGDTLLAAHLAQHARDSELRLAALAQVSDPETLAECALQDTVAAVRLAAATRLEDRPALERVARLIGKRDKRVYREARSRLKAIAEREQEPARIRALAQDLCERAQRLGRTGAWSQDRAVMALLRRQWDELGDPPPGELAAQFQAAEADFNQAYESYRRANLERIQAQEALERLRADRMGLLQRLDDLDPTDEPDTLEARIGALEAERDGLGTLPEAEEQALARRWQDCTGQLRVQWEQHQALRQRGERLQRLATQADAWLAQAGTLDHKRLKQWRKQGDRLAELVPDDTAARDYQERRERLQARQDKQSAHARDKLARLPERLEQLERMLDEGALRQAGSLHQSIMADLELLEASGLHGGEVQEPVRRIRGITPRLRELQSWRRWGTDQHRTDLVDAMERLVEADQPLEELTARVQELQDAWKRLDRGGSPINESLWQRFHQAGEKAYARCQPYLEEQAREREANLAAREAICAQLEDFLAQVDWQRMDWKKAARAEREMRDAWGAIGPVDPRRRKPLDRRYKAAMKRLDEELDKERTRNRAFKQELIEKARALALEPDLERAIEAIKGLQQAWHTTVAGRRKQENQLWDHFRCACDQVFERRREEQQAQRQEQEGHVQACRDLCTGLEALAGGEEQDPLALLHAGNQLQGRWGELSSQPLPRQERLRLQRRWDDALRALDERVQALRRAAEQTQLARLRARAVLCLELEAAVTEGGDRDTRGWLARWEALPAPEGRHWGDGGEGRFQAALAALEDPATRGPWEAERENNLPVRSELCLKMEVLAGIDSPPGAARERLAFQVGRLSERLAQGGGDALEEAPQVETDWYLAGPAPAMHVGPLEERFERARTALARTPAEPPATAAEG